MGGTHLMSSEVDLAVFSIKSVSDGAKRSKTTLRILDLPPLCARRDPSATTHTVEQAAPSSPR